MMTGWLVFAAFMTLGADTGTDFERYFTGGTLRFDYVHSGVATEEHISLDLIRAEGPWAGSRTQLLDQSNLGKYFFEVIDLATNRAIYSRGFCSIFGEWETTGEARRGIWRSFQESQRFPQPKMPCLLVLKKRGANGAFHEIYSQTIDPRDRFVDRAPVQAHGEVRTVLENGPVDRKLDLLILGDGYTAAQMAKFNADVDRLLGALFNSEPFKAHKSDFNVRAICPTAPQSGIDNPRKGVWVNNPLGLSFNSFDSDRYVLTYADRAVREIAAAAPYDALMILANSSKYGGGGIFNLYATTSTDSASSEYVFVHEFGHSFAGLADEYYTSSVAYESFNPPGAEPWEPNVTALLDPHQLKWAALADSGIPIPTPWDQENYDQTSLAFQKRRGELINSGAADSEVDQLFAEVKRVTSTMLASQTHAGKVGAFEGAGYEAKGLYRPEVDCIMFTRNPTDFCRVCSAAIERVLELYTR